ncbi:hypothetical protein KIL84_008551 [Mauremys mutica]|uniref:Uncharacterized protein n=1 Tax=Mauremys mutica TaxID=74926 RepID=A0A9D3X8R1_9SAUR|nr:hypothetical protein KIL84_008551 [Mauremys mutica]
MYPLHSRALKGTDLCRGTHHVGGILGGTDPPRCTCPRVVGGHRSTQTHLQCGWVPGGTDPPRPTCPKGGGIPGEAAPTPRQAWQPEGVVTEAKNVCQSRRLLHGQQVGFKEPVLITPKLLPHAVELCSTYDPPPILGHGPLPCTPHAPHPPLSLSDFLQAITSLSGIVLAKKGLGLGSAVLGVEGKGTWAEPALGWRPSPPFDFVHTEGGGGQL